MLLLVVLGQVGGCSVLPSHEHKPDSSDGEQQGRSLLSVLHLSRRDISLRLPQNSTGPRSRIVKPSAINQADRFILYVMGNYDKCSCII